MKYLLRFAVAVPSLAVPLLLQACGGTSTGPQDQHGQHDSGGNPADAATDAIVVTDGGDVDAGSWTEVSPPPSLGAGSAVATTGPSDVWVTGNGPILHYDGKQWTSVFDDGMSSFGSLWANSPTDVWAVGYYPGPDSMLAGSIAHWDGTAWKDVTDAPPTNELFRVWASGPSDVWAVGDEVQGGNLEAVVLHFNGTTWSVAHTEPIQDFGSVWGSGPHDVWVSGLRKTVHFDGATWSEAGPASPTVHTVEVWGTSATDVWAWGTDDGGINGMLFHYDGSNWSTGTPLGDALSLSRMWGSSPSDIWAVGVNGTSGFNRSLMAHWDGRTWAVLPQSKTSPVLSDIAGSGPGNIWCAGEAVLRLE